MYLFNQQFRPVLFIIFYFHSMFVPCRFYRNGNNKGRRKIDYTATASTVQSHQTEVHLSGATLGHRRYPRQEVATLPLAENLNYMADKALEKEHHSFSKLPGDYVELDCDTDAANAILKEYARASRQWIHNNNSLEIENDRMVYQMGMLTIQPLKTSDQGVFICRIEYEPKQFKTVALFTLIVESNESVLRVRETSVMALQSNSASLGYIFPTATRAWWHRDKMVRQNISASLAGEDRFLHTNESFELDWVCIVTHQLKGGIKRTWKTARYLVQVTPPPTELENFWAYCSKHSVTIVMGSLVICGFILVMFVVCVSQADKAKTEAQDEMDKMTERLLSNNEKSQKDVNQSNVDCGYSAYQDDRGYDGFLTQENERDDYRYENGHTSCYRESECDDDYDYKQGQYITRSRYDTPQ